MPNIITRDEYLEISTVPLATPAWRILDLSPLWDGPQVRGDDLLIPGTAGVLTQPRRATVTRKVLPIAIFGEQDWEGNVYADPFTGVRTNLDYLYTNVFAPVGTGDGTRAATHHLKSGATRTANIIVLSPLDVRPAGKHSLIGRLDILIPDGRFT